MDLQQLPQDPAILLSYINTKLRDLYPSIEALCDDMHIDQQALLQRMLDNGYEYSRQHNKFW